MAKQRGSFRFLADLVFGAVFALFLYFGAKMVIAESITIGAFVAFNTY